MGSGDETKPVFALLYSLSGAPSSAKSSSMASQPAPGLLAATDINSFIRGFHEYKDIWQPMVRENLILKKEPTNEKGQACLFCVQKDKLWAMCHEILLNYFFFWIEKSMEALQK